MIGGPRSFALRLLLILATLAVWEGLESLALTYPVAMWLARVLVAGGQPPDAAVTRAVRMVDDNFGFNPLLGSVRQKTALRMLATRGELPRLVAWYGKTQRQTDEWREAAKSEAGG